MERTIIDKVYETNRKGYSGELFKHSTKKHILSKEYGEFLDLIFEVNRNLATLESIEDKREYLAEEVLKVFDAENSEFTIFDSPHMRILLRYARLPWYGNGISTTQEIVKNIGAVRAMIYSYIEQWMEAEKLERRFKAFDVYNAYYGALDELYRTATNQRKQSAFRFKMLPTPTEKERTEAASLLIEKYPQFKDAKPEQVVNGECFHIYQACGETEQAVRAMRAESLEQELKNIPRPTFEQVIDKYFDRVTMFLYWRENYLKHFRELCIHHKINPKDLAIRYRLPDIRAILQADYIRGPEKEQAVNMATDGYAFSRQCTFSLMDLESLLPDYASTYPEEWDCIATEEELKELQIQNEAGGQPLVVNSEGDLTEAAPAPTQGEPDNGKFKTFTHAEIAHYCHYRQEIGTLIRFDSYPGMTKTDAINKFWNDNNIAHLDSKKFESIYNKITHPFEGKDTRIEYGGGKRVADRFHKVINLYEEEGYNQEAELAKEEFKQSKYYYH